MRDVNATARTVCVSQELAFRAGMSRVQCPGDRTNEDRADELIDMLVAVVADLRGGQDLRESVATIGGRVFAWLEAIDAEAAR